MKVINNCFENAMLFGIPKKFDVELTSGSRKLFSASIKLFHSSILQSQRRPAAVKPVDTFKLPVDKGSCREANARFFYNMKTGTCQYFLFGGCGGNKNQRTKY